MPHNMPLLLPNHQLEADDVQAVDIELIQREVLRLALEDCETTTTVLAQHRYLCDAVPD